MKKLFPFLLICLISKTALSNTPSVQKKNKIEQQTITKALQTESSATSEITLAQNEIFIVTSTELWRNLDINRDDSISKPEAVYSKKISDNWNKLDSNKDEKIDFDEFTNQFPKEN